MEQENDDFPAILPNDAGTLVTDPADLPNVSAAAFSSQNSLAVKTRS